MVDTNGKARRAAKGDGEGSGPGGTRELNNQLRMLAEEYAQLAREVLSDNLTSVILFGSVARGDAVPASDIDLLVVCRELPAGAFRRRSLLEPIRERLQPRLQQLWDRGIYVDFAEVLRTESEATRTHPIYLDMVEEGVRLFDRNGFFASVLAQLRERLEELGAQRRQLGRVIYWDLKPDFRAGEVIEL